jgi:hypothetical protein
MRAVVDAAETYVRRGGTVSVAPETRLFDPVVSA